MFFPSISNDNYSNGSEMNTEEVVCDEIDEDDETCAAVDRDTCLMMLILIQKNWYLLMVKEKNLLVYSQTKTLNIWLFQQFFCGERCKRGDVTVYNSEICKYKLRSVNRRVAKCSKHVLQVEEGMNEVY